MDQPVRVFVIDDNRLFAEAIAAFLGAREELTLVGLTASRDGMLEKARSAVTDVVLINATIEEVDTVQLIRMVKEELPDVKVVVLGLGHREDNNLKFIEAGASGYMFKEGSMAELLRTIELVQRGRTLCSPRMAALVFDRIAGLCQEVSQGAMLQKVKLTPREKETLKLIAKGFNNKEIAHHFHVTLHTVKNHVHNILEKLQVHRRQEAIRWAHENGYLRDPRLAPCFSEKSVLQRQDKAEGLEKNESRF